MASRKLLRGAIGNFLGTFVSRYTEYRGYWLFGFMVADLDIWQMDLLVTRVPFARSPRETASQIAASKFQDQVQKAGLSLSQIQAASLIVQRLPEVTQCEISGQIHPAFHVKFSIAATTDLGQTFCHEKTVIVAPHHDHCKVCRGWHFTIWRWLRNLVFAKSKAATL